jgi:single-strand DNA-binding protein
MINSCTISGRVGKDSELKTVGDKQVLNWSLAWDTGWGDNKKTNWLNCALWGKQATALGDIVRKGMPLVVTGQLSTRDWQDKNGATKTSVELNVTQLQLPPKQSSQPDQAAGDDVYV